MGPSGTFNSKALMGKGEARVTATAAVHSEAFVLTRDVFIAIKSDKGDGDGRQGGSPNPNPNPNPKPNPNPNPDPNPDPDPSPKPNLIPIPDS